MNKDKTPEEKLLKLIRKRKKAADRSTGPDLADHSQKEEKRKSSDNQKTQEHVLLIINRLLLVVALVMTGYCLVQLFYYFDRGEPVPVTLNEDEKDVPELSFKYWIDRVPKDLFLREIERRNVFQSPWTIKSVNSTGRSAGASDLSDELKLVGIVLDDDPKAIVIDRQSGQTLFLSEGEQANEIFVEKISEDKVLLLHNGRQIELVK